VRSRVGARFGTAALERFTGYTGQSRSRHATHTWNVTRLPEVDHGVLADQRTVEAEVLNALRRKPDTGFAIHDAPGRVERLRAEQTELRALLQERPPDRRPAFRQAELALASAKKELHWAQHRLEHAHQRLDDLGPFSQVRRKGRDVKRSTLEQISTSSDDVRTAEAKIVRCEQAVEELRPELDERRRWDAGHDWPDSRLRTVEAELAELGQPAHRTSSRDASLLRRAPDRGRPAWLDRLAETPQPPLPGPDLGARHRPRALKSSSGRIQRLG
jgi:hypothetical protein